MSRRGVGRVGALGLPEREGIEVGGTEDLTLQRSQGVDRETSAGGYRVEGDGGGCRRVRDPFPRTRPRGIAGILSMAADRGDRRGGVRLHGVRLQDSAA
jgi:hypothetical protein